MDVNEFLERARVIVLLARSEQNRATLAAIDRSEVARGAVNLLCELLPAALCEPMDRDTRRKRAFEWQE